MKYKYYKIGVGYDFIYLQVDYEEQYKSLSKGDGFLEAWERKYFGKPSKSDNLDERIDNIIEEAAKERAKHCSSLQPSLYKPDDYRYLKYYESFDGKIEEISEDIFKKRSLVVKLKR